jgi:hypothetical protein
MQRQLDAVLSQVYEKTLCQPSLNGLHKLA